MFAAAPVLLAQQPSPPADAPIFRSGIDLVTVDASVLDDEGRPLADLGAADFELRVDGHRRGVVSAQFVAVGRDVRSAEDTPRPAHYSTNEHIPSSRLILFVVDREHIRRTDGPAALRAAGQFIDSLQPFDRVAATGIPRVAPLLEFTTDHRSVRSALQNLAGQATSVVPVELQIGIAEALEISEGSRQHLEVAVRRECGTSLGVTENPARTAEEGLGRDPCPVHVEQQARIQAQHARNQTLTSLAALREFSNRYGRSRVRRRSSCCRRAWSRSLATLTSHSSLLPQPLLARQFTSFISRRRFYLMPPRSGSRRRSCRTATSARTG
jgi:hypothetical protein